MPLSTTEKGIIDLFARLHGMEIDGTDVNNADLMGIFNRFKNSLLDLHDEYKSTGNRGLDIVNDCVSSFNKFYDSVLPLYIKKDSDTSSLMVITLFFYQKEILELERLLAMKKSREPSRS
jgi:hypothetical protein